MELEDRVQGCMLGLAAGDAVGTTVEFRERGSFEPLTDMVGGGPFRLLPGQWTDDTSMALCLATSLVEQKAFDAHDQMQRYCNWWKYGYLSSNGTCFDIGGTIVAALRRFDESSDPCAGSTDPRSAGNGCIMRLAPVPIFYLSDLQATERYAMESSRTTHATLECLDACRLLARILHRALHGSTKEEILLGDRESFTGAANITAIARGEYLEKPEVDIRGTGYVVACLEAAMWCFEKTNSFESAILTAANLGDDADTTAAVCGQIAGAHYGVSAIPDNWLNRLALRDEITTLATQLLR
jgi:ADP-ribosyl-[dinitrogen reductase] hydrolase